MRVKDYLSVREIEFDSFNVLDDKVALARLQNLGARSVPVVARGDQFVYAQVIADVVQFLDLPDDTRPQLSPAELMARYDAILTKAIALVAAMPDRFLDNELPNRPRSWRVLMHHLFQIPAAFVDAQATGDTLTYENLVAPPPTDMITSAQIAAFGRRVQADFGRYCQQAGDESFDGRVDTYFGQTSRHELLERTVWHSTQHVRQVHDLLVQAGCEPPVAITAADTDRLPLTDAIWDEAVS